MVHYTVHATKFFVGLKKKFYASPDSCASFLTFLTALALVPCLLDQIASGRHGTHAPCLQPPILAPEDMLIKYLPPSPHNHQFLLRKTC